MIARGARRDAVDAVAERAAATLDLALSLGEPGPSADLDVSVESLDEVAAAITRLMPGAVGGVDEIHRAGDLPARRRASAVATRTPAS